MLKSNSASENHTLCSEKFTCLSKNIFMNLHVWNSYANVSKFCDTWACWFLYVDSTRNLVVMTVSVLIFWFFFVNFLDESRLITKTKRFLTNKKKSISITFAVHGVLEMTLLSAEIKSHSKVSKRHSKSLFQHSIR
jgi:hypothetical protein